MRAVAAAAVALTLAAPAGGVRTPDAGLGELLGGATVVVPDGLKPRESPQRLALRVLTAAPAGERISYVELFPNGVTLCVAHPELTCYATSLGRLWYLRLVARTTARFAPPEPAAVPQRSATVVAVDGGRILRKPPTGP